MTKWVIILGANGALGRAVSHRFASSSWRRIMCDVSSSSSLDGLFVQLKPGSALSEQYISIENVLTSEAGSAAKVGAIINVGGGFRMEDASSDELFNHLNLMYSSSVESSMLSARLASRFLVDDGLLVLPGAASALSPTPWALSYGAMKAAVHHMVKSLSTKGSGLPNGSRVVGIAPVMLDTPANRSSMPDADLSTWTPVEEVADRLVRWAEKEDVPENGAMYKVTTSAGVTSYTSV